MLFDSHAHVQFAAYDNDRDDVIKRSLDQGIWMTNIGTSFATSKAAVDLATKYEKGVYATIGLHPSHSWQTHSDPDESQDIEQQTFDSQQYKSLLTAKVVAVGEIGLDYFRMPGENAEAKKLQKTALIEQLYFAQKNNLPIVIHCRDAYDDMLEILKAEYKGAGILHSFTDSPETAKKFLDLGFHVALNAILLFDKTGRLVESCKYIPLDRLLIETDAPYLAPEPYRGKRNEPSYVKFVAEEVAAVKNISLEAVSNATYANALGVYKIEIN